MLDQYNLFETTETHTADTPSHTVVTPISHATVDPNKSLFPDSNPNGLWSFAVREAHRMWEAETHRGRSLAQLEKFIKFDPEYSKFALTDFLPKHINAFIDSLRADGLSSSSLNRYSATISKCFTHAVDEKEADMAFRLKFYKEKDRNRVRVYNNDELAKIKDWFLNDTCDSHGYVGSTWMWDMCVISSKSGMRRNEIISIGKVIRGHKAVLSSDEQWLILHGQITKTGKGRKIPMTNPEVLAAVKRLQVSLQYVWSDKTFYRRWAKMVADLFPNDKEAVFHAMRHTAASKMANELKMPTAIIAAYLGHQSITTTEKYVHANDDTLLQAGAKM